jgi:hypothetical protein
MDACESDMQRKQMQGERMLRLSLPRSHLLGKIKMTRKDFLSAMAGTADSCPLKVCSAVPLYLLNNRRPANESFLIKKSRSEGHLGIKAFWREK